MNIERIKALAEGARKVAEVVDEVTQKGVVFIEAFAKELDKQVEQYEAERAEAMRRHPAGKGRVENGTLTRNDMITYIIKNGTPIYKWVYEYQDLSNISDETVEYDFNTVKAAVEKQSPTNTSRY